LPRQAEELSVARTRRVPATSPQQSSPVKSEISAPARFENSRIAVTQAIRESRVPHTPALRVGIFSLLVTRLSPLATASPDLIRRSFCSAAFQAAALPRNGFVAPPSTLQPVSAASALKFRHAPTTPHLSAE